MRLVDYHLHSNFSFDGQETIEDIANCAIGRGFSEIAITDHLDIVASMPYTWQLDYHKMAREVQAAQERFRGKLQIRLGVELGQPQHNAAAAQAFLQESGALDFIIGSIHNLENNKDVDTYDFSTIDCDALYARYLDAVILMAEQFDFDVAGHLTYPLRYMAEKNQKTIDLIQFTERYRRLFQILLEKGRGIECNVSGLRQKIGATFPPLSVLKLYRECGGEIITIGSDAHRIADVGKGVLEGMRLLEDAGFRYIAKFEKRKVEFYKL